MVTASPPKHRATAVDLTALPEDVRAEVIAGEIVEKAAPSAEHGLAQAALTSSVGSAFGRRAGGGAPGGWWILTEVDVELDPHEVYRPDVAGWRRDHVPGPPSGRPVLVRPDWICEILSPSNAQHDLVVKFRAYHRAGVPHYWIVDPDKKTLVVHRWREEGYLVATVARSGEAVRAEPFDLISIDVGALFGEETDSVIPACP